MQPTSKPPRLTCSVLQQYYLEQIKRHNLLILQNLVGGGGGVEPIDRP